jgi:hypothetical protein
VALVGIYYFADAAFADFDDVAVFYNRLIIRYFAFVYLYRTLCKQASCLALAFDQADFQ